MIYYQIISEDKYSIYDYISLNLILTQELATNPRIKCKINLIYLKDIKEYTEEHSDYPDTYYKILTPKGN